MNTVWQPGGASAAPRVPLVSTNPVSDGSTSASAVAGAGAEPPTEPPRWRVLRVRCGGGGGTTAVDRTSRGRAAAVGVVACSAHEDLNRAARLLNKQTRQKRRSPPEHTALYVCMSLASLALQPSVLQSFRVRVATRALKGPTPVLRGGQQAVLGPQVSGVRPFSQLQLEGLGNL